MTDTANLDLTAITLGNYRVVHNGSTNYVLEWLDADGKPTGSARPATPQEYEMFASIDVAIVTLRSVMTTNDQLRDELKRTGEAVDNAAAAVRKMTTERDAEREMKEQAQGRLSAALDFAAMLAEVEPKQRAERLTEIISDVMKDVRRTMAQDA